MEYIEKLIAYVSGLVKENSELGTNFSWRILQEFSSRVAFFGIFLMAASYLTPTSFGNFNYYLTIAAVFASLPRLGLGTSVSKYVAEYEEDDPGLISTVLVSACLATLGFAVVLTVVAVAIDSFVVSVGLPIGVLVVLVLFRGLVYIFDGFLRGLKEFKKISISFTVGGVVSLFFAYYIVKGYGTIGALAALILYNVFVFVLLVYYSPARSLDFDYRMLERVLKYGSVVGAQGLVHFLNTDVDILILKYFSYTVEIGYYQIINKMFLFVIVPFVLLGQTVAPDMSKANSHGRHEYLLKQTKRISLTFAAGIVISGTLFFVFPEFIRAVFPKYYSSNFVQIFHVLLLLLPFKISGALLTHGLINPTGRASIVTKIAFLGGILNVVLSIALLREFGFIGIFFATALIHSISTVIFYVLYYRSVRSATG